MPRDGASATDAPACKRPRGRERVFVFLLLLPTPALYHIPPAPISHSASNQVSRRARTSPCTVSVSGHSSLLRWRPSSALILGLSRDMSVPALRSHNQHTAAVSRALDPPARPSLAPIACGDRAARSPPQLRRGRPAAAPTPHCGPRPVHTRGLPPATRASVFPRPPAHERPLLPRFARASSVSIHTCSRRSDLWTLIDSRGRRADETWLLRHVSSLLSATLVVYYAYYDMGAGREWFDSPLQQDEPVIFSHPRYNMGLHCRGPLQQHDGCMYGR